MRKFLLLFTLISATIFATAQQKVDLAFDATEFDFGNIAEEGGRVSHDFRFVNTGTAPFTILTVTASCGCTTPDWTKTSVQPSDSGIVRVIFDPNDRPGPFQKSVRVVIAGESGNITEILDIFGQVVPRSESLENRYPYHFGAVYTRSAIVSFDSVRHGDVAESTLTLVNASDEPVSFALALPDYVDCDAPTALEPQSETLVTLRYRSAQSDAWGFVNEPIAMIVGGKNEGVIRLQATVYEDFTQLSREDRITAPIASLQQKNVDFGTISIGKKYTQTITLSNYGQNPLMVRAIISSSDYLKATAKKSVVKSGKSVKISIEVDATNLQPFSFVKNLQLMTNDPTNPIQNIVVTWETKEN